MADQDNNNYQWNYCKIGGVTRVKITSGEDIAHLGELDKKLWTVLSCPVSGLEFDEKTLKLLDANNDGKIRVDEVIAAAQWMTSVLKNPDLILKHKKAIKLSAFNKDNPEGLKLYKSAKQILANLGALPEDKTEDKKDDAEIKEEKAEKKEETAEKKEETAESKEEKAEKKEEKAEKKEEKAESKEEKAEKKEETAESKEEKAEKKEETAKKSKKKNKVKKVDPDSLIKISLDQASDSIAIFAKTALNGDGVITEQSTTDEALQGVIKAAVETLGGVDDRSGLKGINTDLLDKFYAACADYKAWKDAGIDDIFVFGDDTSAALDACNAIKEKIADYFMRCKLAAFSNESTAALDVSVERIGEISAKDLAASVEEISAYPIARITGKAVLPLDNASINPAWQDAFAKAKALVIDKAFPGATEITEAQWKEILAKFDAYIAWNDAKKGAEVESLGLERIEEILKADQKAALADLIEQDKALEQESKDIDAVEKFLRYYRYFYKLLKNYVTLSDFYSRKPKRLPVFLAGTLYVDQRSTDLCIKVADMAKQGDVAELSGMYILYCDCTSKVKNQTMTIAAVLTDGDVDDLRVGKNAVFYDRDGHDWDAVITKIVDNPISVRQAFWSPYKKLYRFVYEKINKTAAEKNASAEESLTAKADAVKVPAAGEAAPADAAAGGKLAGFDIAKFAGIAAAMGMALAAIGAVFVGIISGVKALTWWQWLIIIAAIILIISGPSMFLAWQKLRKRNLAPVLNANGWAINSRILVNIPFGTTFTSLAKYPKLNVEDPYAPKTNIIWKVLGWLLVIAVAVLLTLKFTGTWDIVKYISEKTAQEAPADPAADAPAADAPAADAPAPDAPAE